MSILRSLVFASGADKTIFIYQRLRRKNHFAFFNRAGELAGSNKSCFISHSNMNPGDTNPQWFRDIEALQAAMRAVCNAPGTPILKLGKLYNGNSCNWYYMNLTASNLSATGFMTGEWGNPTTPTALIGWVVCCINTGTTEHNIFGGGDVGTSFSIFPVNAPPPAATLGVSLISGQT